MNFKLGIIFILFPQIPNHQRVNVLCNSGRNKNYNIITCRREEDKIGLVTLK